jgi:hypothetical protein
MHDKVWSSSEGQTAGSSESSGLSVRGKCAFGGGDQPKGSDGGTEELDRGTSKECLSVVLDY